MADTYLADLSNATEIVLDARKSVHAAAPTQRRPGIRPGSASRLAAGAVSLGNAAGAAMTTSPKKIRITFNESVIAQFCGVEVKDQTGKVISTGKAATDPANKKLLVVPLKEQLPPGDYKVEWHAVSDDTHRVKGNYSFSVAR